MNLGENNLCSLNWIAKKGTGVISKILNKVSGKGDNTNFDATINQSEEIRRNEGKYGV